jgi:uncharacterized delta-60 repeat protein
MRSFGPRKLIGSAALSALTALVIGVTAVAAFAAAGDLDSTFGTGGKVKTSFTGGYDGAHAIAIQSNGKILAAGHAGDEFAVARYKTDGTLDTNFGTNGIETVSAVGSGAAVYASDVVVQPDGKILVAGQGTGGAVLVRLLTTGKPDTGFATGGVATVDFLGNASGAYAVALQANGRIVIAGYAHNGAQRSFFAFARFTTSGLPDTSFSGDGKEVRGFSSGNSFAWDVLIQPSDQKILAVGRADSASNGSLIAMVRLNVDGTLDTGFSGNGFAAFTDGPGAYGKSAAIDGAGQILVAGQGNGGDFAMIEVGSSGSLVANFGTGGKVLQDLGSAEDFDESMAVQSDGKPVLAGETYTGTAHGYDFAVVRFKTNGAIDGTFGSNGIVLTDLGADDEAGGVAIQSNGRIVVAGITFTSNTNGRFALARYLA